MGGTGNFSKPPEGPKIGPTKKFSELSEDKQRELGDIAAAAKNKVFTPAKMDPRVAKEEQKTEEPEEKQWDVGAADDRAVQAAETLEALQNVVSTDDEKYQDEVELEAAPTDEDKQELFRSILGGLRYEKKFELFGGMLRVTMVELTPREEERIFEEMGKAQREGAIHTEDDWSVLFERLRLAYSLREIQHTGQDTYSRDPEAADAICYGDAARIMDQFKGSILWQAVSHVGRVFRRQLDFMVELALSPDFWKVGGPDSQQSQQEEAPSTTAVDPQPDRGDSSNESSSIESSGS